MSVVSRALSAPRFRIPAVLAVVPLAVVAVTLAVGLAFAGRLLPGVHVGGVDVGALPLSEARERLSSTNALAGERVHVVVEGREWSTTFGALGIASDVDGAVAGAYAFGHEGSPLQRAGAWAEALTGGIDVALPRRATDDRLASFLAGISAAVDRPVVDGAIAISPAGVTVTEPREGVRFPASRAAFDITAPGAIGPRLVEETPQAVVPVVGTAEMATARERATAAFAPLIVTVGDTTIEVDATRAVSLVRIEQGGAGLEARVDATALDALARELAGKIDREPRDAAYRPSATGFDVVPGQDGVAVDRAALGRLLASAVFAPGDGRTVRAPAEITQPALTTDAARRFASSITLVASYSTSFPVNWARATNIAAGSSAFNGIVLGPGESFSFWGRIGEVSTRTGYVVSGAIIDGRSSEAIGGGLCQVSTTLFGAVVRAGPQIDERSAHSYYIERYQLGLDAAVFYPGQDMRFTNDTPYPLYIRAASTSTSVTFWLYSVPTGREVSFSAPTQANLTMPAPTQPADSAYPAGYVVRGRDVWVTRTVTENGAVVHRDTFSSHYAPVWGGGPVLVIR